MVSLRMQMSGSALALLGWVGVLLTCLIPVWRVTAFMGITIVTSEVMWEGIWMTCTIRSTGYIQCKPYYSMLVLSTDLRAAQILTVGSILTGLLGHILTFIGGKCTRFLDHSRDGRKDRVATAAGVTLMISGLLCLIPVSWSAIAVVQAFYSPHLINAQRREIGAAIYIGCGSSIMLLLGGLMICSTSCNPKADHKSPPVKYMIVRSSQAGSSNGSLQQVRITELATNRGLAMMSKWNYGKTASLVSTGFEQNEALSAKSKMIPTGSNQSLVSSQMSQSSSSIPEKTYI